jgi:hypothetical protein
MKTTNETNGRGLKARCADACRGAVRKLRQLEEQFAAKLIAEVQSGVPRRLVEQAINEAEALAWNTQFPLLFLPELAEEKIEGARQWARRQQDILQR